MAPTSVLFFALLVLFDDRVGALRPSGARLLVKTGQASRVEAFRFMANDGDADDMDLPEIDFDGLMDKNNIPKPPQNPDEIDADSFEGFLREEYLTILEDNELLDFTGFYVWRHKMGIVYSEDEMADLFTSIIEDAGAPGLDLMNFIKINRIIDDGNAAIEDGLSW